MRKVDPLGRIIQDTGTGGSYPCSSDRIVWAVAAWEIYLVTGDSSWLATIYPIIRRTVEQDLAVVYYFSSRFLRGEQAFLDWREQEYPRWANPTDIAVSEALSPMRFLSATAILRRCAASTANRAAPNVCSISAGLHKHQCICECAKGLFMAIIFTGAGNNTLRAANSRQCAGNTVDIASPQQQHGLSPPPAVGLRYALFSPKFRRFRPITTTPFGLLCRVFGSEHRSKPTINAV